MNNLILGNILTVLGASLIAVFLIMFVSSCSDDSSERRYAKKVHRSGSHIFGIDVSHYQGHINWNKVSDSHHPIEYAFIRATMGIDGKDRWFNRNWKNAKKHQYLRGAYHYYRPNEDSDKQVENFIKSVKLRPGDMPPVLDIESLGNRSHHQVREGVLNWLQKIEAHYGIRPIVYTGRTFYRNYLTGYLDDYPLWIASYSGKHMLEGIDWDFHQFTEKVRVTGIQHKTDGNDFNGSYSKLLQLCIQPNT